MFDDPRNRLQWMEHELLEEEEEEDDLMRRVDDLLEEEEDVDFSPTVRRGREPDPAFFRAGYESFDQEAAAEPPARKKGIGGLVLLAILETAAIVAVARWWLQWL